MRILSILICIFLSYTLSAQNDRDEIIHFFPVQHASFVIQSPETTIFVDPVGSLKQYSLFPVPNIVLLTHEHGDHFDSGLIKKIVGPNTIIIEPKVVNNKLGTGTVLNNGDSIFIGNIKIVAVPMYNITAGRLNYHLKGVGNGYVINIAGKRVYISGDTEDIPEMRNLKNIDYAFICMNLPYTMSADQAASAILEMKPSNVYPYHFRNSTGDYEKVLDKFKDLISTNPDIKVHVLKWY